MKPARSIAPAPTSPTPPSPHIPTGADVQEYMPLVRQAVARFLRRLPPNVLRDDLLAAGTFGLIDSLRKNGKERGPTFEWYARIRIRGAILDELRSQDWLTRRARGHATAAQSESPSSSRVASVVGFDDLPERGRALSMADETTRSPHEMLEHSRERAALGKAVAELPERERTIVTLHYFQGVEFKTIAQKLGVSEPRISQLHSRAMGKLRVLMAGTADQAA
jgi:RNA polymerase sigma factor for flagellar operon FliA